ncbi:carcinoembryonic antigen-related cell adhesion molecule 1 isoform X1 [Lepus europaeus]|uniref:carcinoembryonic antigen-related cell adhesion molecule 1 isoform X1 n=1 Tax=Lepus europaeus TaxID=9983 RepID=UPI002B47122E|nr:carcinoembryonic antigen-related cell adhesion molecule 1 isoform X1 [Lepus europaeus]
MEPSSAPPCRMCVPRLGLLLAVSLLTAWIPTTVAQLTVEPVPPDAAEGMDVLLLVYNLPENSPVYLWYKGETADPNRLIATYVTSLGNTAPGPAYSARDRILSNGSLLIQNVTLEDTGNYTIQAMNILYVPSEASAQFRVYPKLPEPHITSNQSQPVEGEDSVAFTCEPEIQNITYLWWIHGQRLPETTDRLQLSPDNRTLTVLSVTRNDTGPYECGVSNPGNTARSDPFSMNVSYGPDAPTISPPDLYYCSGANLSLFCHAVSDPPAQYSWLVNGRLQQATQELLVPNVSVNNSGSYTCHVNNSITGLNRITVENITVFGPVAQPAIRVINTTVLERDRLVLTCLTDDAGISIRWIFNSQSLNLTARTRLSPGNSTLNIYPVMKVDEGEYQCEAFHLNCSSKSDPLWMTVKDNPEPESSDLLPGAIAGIVIGVVAGVALIAVLAYFLYCSKTGRSGPL